MCVPVMYCTKLHKDGTQEILYEQIQEEQLASKHREAWYTARQEVR